jgi:hypothetical protein
MRVIKNMDVDESMISEPLRDWIGQEDPDWGQIVGAMKVYGVAVRTVGRKTVRQLTVSSMNLSKGRRRSMIRPASLTLYFV